MESYLFKNRLYSTLQRVLIVILIIAISFSLVYISKVYVRIEKQTKNEVYHIFNKSIEEELKINMSKEYSAIQLFNEPINEEIGTVKTIIIGDTIIKRDIQTDNEKDDVYNSFITYLKFKNRLNTDSVSSIFRDKLKDNKIDVTSFVLLKYDDTTEISGDTTYCTISYRTPMIHYGFSDEISFQGLVCYTPLSIIKLIPRYLFYIFISVVCLVTLSLFYLLRKGNAIQPDKIMKLKNGNYYIGLIYFDKEKMTLQSECKTVTLTPLITSILKFFLESNGYTANKIELQKKFWQTITSYNSMTSSINRLRTFLKDANSTFKITTPKGSDYYMLVHDGEEEN